MKRNRNKRKEQGMRDTRFASGLCLVAALMLLSATPAVANVGVQCPPDTDGIDTNMDGLVDNDNVCMHLSAGDGYTQMADGKLQYIFSFSNLTGIEDIDMALMQGMRAAVFPAPTIYMREGEKLYLTLTNVGMMDRPDLFDPHTVHWHGYPNAASIFDGVPDASISVNMGASLTYFYTSPGPGTYMYHCHVEATEHMQMGMLGNLYILPYQDMLPDLTDLNGFVHHTGYKYTYNDGDGSTYYDVDYPIQLGSFDPDFHDSSMGTEPLPFALMQDKYAMLNGRGYPDTVGPDRIATLEENNGVNSQPMNSLVEATQGDKVLLRLSNLNVTRFYTLAVTGMKMKVIGKDAKILRGPTGLNLYYDTTSITLGGGESADVLLDTSTVPPGTYFLYTTNLNYLSNNNEDFGGMMTEIRVTAGD